MKSFATCLVLLPAACGQPEDPVAENRDQGREETRNTEAIGYAGDPLADKVDGALDANDNRKRQLDEAEQSQY